jgi:hypothetical protein
MRLVERARPPRPDAPPLDLFLEFDFSEEVPPEPEPVIEATVDVLPPAAADLLEATSVTISRTPAVPGEAVPEPSPSRKKRKDRRRKRNRRASDSPDAAASPVTLSPPPGEPTSTAPMPTQSPAAGSSPGPEPTGDSFGAGVLSSE